MPESANAKHSKNRKLVFVNGGGGVIDELSFAKTCAKIYKYFYRSDVKGYYAHIHH